MNIGLNNNGSPVSFFSGIAYNADVYYSSYITGTNNFSNHAPSLLLVYPNPAYQFMTLKINLTNPGQTVFRLSDYSGKPVLSFNKETVQPGEQTFTINTGNIPTGEYILQMNAGNVIEKKKVTIIK